ncbi:MAG: glycerol-3-phosphate 1-O-acyltransferase PlsY [Chthoniobacterales bacterium]|nr:glycerol-3-phosphate 1-O-acyltransferase PlsY [Chthoniobacterales bacterium]
MNGLIFPTLAFGAFLLGSIPTGYLVARARGVDIRRHGSGNIGATNVLRTLGKPLGIFVFVVDALKGFMAVWIAKSFGDGSAADWLGIIAAVAVIAGHNYTPWLGFKGGKGIATSAGVLLAFSPWTVLFITVVWFVFFKTTHYVSVASIAASVAVPVSIGALWSGGIAGSAPLFVFALVISALAIWRHRSNIRRLREGTEPRFASKSQA